MKLGSLGGVQWSLMLLVFLLPCVYCVALPRCPQPGQEAGHGMCSKHSVPWTAGQHVQCVEMHSLQCGLDPGQPWVEEGTVCYTHLPELDHLAYTCRAGKWTETDSLTVRPRSRRFFGWIIAAVAVLFATAVIAIILHNKPPTISCPKDIKKVADKGRTSTTVWWSTPTARDPDGRRPSVRKTYGPNSGNRVDEGENRVTYVATDNEGGTAICSFKVKVKVIRCPEVKTPDNGRWPQCEGASFRNLYGSKCKFSCSPGYILNGQNQLICQNNARWSHIFPTCSPAICGSAPNISGGSLNCTEGSNYTARCYVQCSAGYRPVGKSYTQCQSDGTWSAVYACEDAEPPTFPEGCHADVATLSGPLASPVNVTWDDPVTKDSSGGKVHVMYDKAPGSTFPPGRHTVKVTAKDEAGNKITCQFFVIVQEKRCPELRIADGHSACDHDTLEGSTCSVSCDTGYVMAGSSEELSCLHQTWTSTPPTCEKVSCLAAPPSVERGVVLCQDSPRYKTSCPLTCDAGYTPTTPAFTVCEAGGDWTLPGPCLDTEVPVLTCPDSVEVIAARLGHDTTVTWSPATATDNSGDIVTTSSDVTPGSTFAPGMTRVTYIADDVSGNRGSCSFSVTVTTQSCGIPDLEEGASKEKVMRYECPQGHQWGSRCSLSCGYGFPLLGQDSISCERDDSVHPALMSWTFNGTKPKCIETIYQKDRQLEPLAHASPLNTAMLGR